MIYSSPQLLKALLIRKGDGNYLLYGGQLQVQRYPPPEAHFEDPAKPDIPAFAHTGGHGENDTGHPGVGHVINGTWVKGEHGEMVWRDDSANEYLHGIDGLIRAVGSEFAKRGIEANPKDVIQRAIDRHNMGRAENDQVPHIDSNEWKKLHMSHLNEGGPVRGKDGQFITTISNGLKHAKDHWLGRFMESYHIPMNKELGAEMAAVGHENPNRHSWIREPYVKPHRLSFAVNPDGELQPAGGSADNLKGRTTLPQRDVQRLLESGLMSGTPEFQNISAWGLGGMKAPTYYLRQPYGNQNPVNINPQTKASFMHEMMQAMGGSPESLANNTIVNSAGAKEFISKLPNNFSIPVEGRNRSLKALLMSGSAGWEKVYGSLSNVVAFQGMFGENKRGRRDANGKLQGSTIGKKNLLYGERYGDMAEEGQGIDKFLGHSARIGNQHIYRTEGGRGLGTHTRAKDHYSHILLAAAHGIAHHEDELSPEALALNNIKLIDNEQERAQIPRLRKVMEVLGNTIMIARGIEPMKIPDQETLRNMQAFTGHDLRGGTHEDPAMLGIPDHVRLVGTTALPIDTEPHITGLGTPSSPHQSVDGAPVRPGAAEMIQGGGQSAATGPPPPNPFNIPGATVTRTPADPSIAGTRFPVDPTTPGLDPLQQVRARVGNAPMEKVRDFMARREMPVTPQRVQQFQQSYGDPYQTQLFDPNQPWMQKSDNLVNVVETIQIDDAMSDMAIMKHVPTRKLDKRSITDILLIAKRMDISPVDVRTILNTKGDWERITKTYGYDEDAIKVVKVSFGGI
jgi:hypothetical protein